MAKKTKSSYYKDIVGCRPGSCVWRIYWENNPEEREEMIKWQDEQGMNTQSMPAWEQRDIKKDEWENLKKELEKLFAEYSIAPFLVALTQVFIDSAVVVDSFVGYTRFRFGNGLTFYLEDDELLMLSGMDTETIKYIKEAAKSKKVKNAQN